MTAHLTMANDETTASPVSFQTQACPDDFFQLPLFPQANLCQIFAEELPASMTYHAKATPQSTKDFYQQQFGQADKESLLKGRIVLEYSNSEKIVIISQDGAGSQVDMLVKSQ